MRPSPPVQLKASPAVKGGTIQIEVTYKYLNERGSFDPDVLFHPVSTTGHIRIALPEQCPANTLGVFAEWKHDFLQPFLEHRGALFWYLLHHPMRGSRLAPDPEEFECLLWYRRADESFPHGSVVISGRDGEALAYAEVSGESPWLEANRWAWLALAGVLEFVLPLKILQRLLRSRAA